MNEKKWLDEIFPKDNEDKKSKSEPLAETKREAVAGDEIFLRESSWNEPEEKKSNETFSEDVILDDVFLQEENLPSDSRGGKKSIPPVIFDDELLTVEYTEEEGEEFLQEKPAPAKEPATQQEEPEEVISLEENDPISPPSQEAETEPEAWNEKEETPAGGGEGQLSFLGGVFDWLKSFLFSLTAVIFVFTLLIRGVTVSGDSMLPTLTDKEYLLISDLFYEPKGGDIVVVRSPNYHEGKEPLIKRIIATEGQTVKINFKTWQVWVDGVLLEEDYIYYEPGFSMDSEDLMPDMNNEAEIVVQENCIFVMGDHRNDSLDSRSEGVGQIDERYIMGRVVLRVTPFEKFGKVK